MARINIVVPKLRADVFSGGLWCIFEYAHGLTSRGHDVTIVPMAPSPYPNWFSHSVGNVITAPPAGKSIKNLIASLYRAGASARSSESRKRSAIRGAFSQACMLRPGLFNEPIRWGIAESYVLEIAPDADITLATSFETARPAYLLNGEKFYFPQHFEVYFSDGFDSPPHADALARQSYNLGFRLIANSTWLRAKLRSELGDVPVALCPNAIDHSVFNGQPKLSTSTREITVISYGGRQAGWKGFREMAQAMAIARSTLREYEIEWRVYGDALVAPNEITPYKPLGFLSPSRLSEEYRKADILLSASWYESFPLFPIEAMACGLAVVTTQMGTEEYAMHGITAEIVEPKDPESIAKGLMKLIQDQDYRRRIAEAGNEKAREFTWDVSVRRLEGILLK